MAETKLYGPIQIAASRAGARLFRNHVGQALQPTSDTPKGWKPPPHLRWVKIGLATGSADFVGWAPYVVKPEDVGRTLAVFASLEVKDEGYMRKEQSAWLETVLAAGGIGGVSHSAEEALAVLAGGPRPLPVR